MSEKVTVETTCDNCGSAIDVHSPRWVADFDDRKDPASPVPVPFGGRSSPTLALHICFDCAKPVLGNLIRNTTKGPRWGTT